MNCKEGDLAIIVSSEAGNEGKIVRCIRFIGKVHGWDGSDRWKIDQELVGVFGGRTMTCRDSRMRPLRNPGEDAKDETLLWKPVPSRDEVPA